nr:xylulose kinase-1 [Tanacetum cinerariifolium]
MKMEHYLCHTDYPIWQVIQNGNGPVSVTTDTNGMIKVLPPKTTKGVVARERERKARTTFLMALPDDHLAKFHKMADAKEMWEAIKSRFGGNDESKKMQKYLLKQQFEGFSMSSSKGLHKGYDRFQTLLSQLEIHDYTPVSPDYSPASNTKTDLSEDPLSDHIPPLLATSPFLSLIDDPSNSVTPDTPPSPTHGIPFTDITLSTQSSPATSSALHHRVMILAPGQPIPHGRSYRYHSNGPIHMMTARKRVGLLPTHRHIVRHSVDYSSLDHFTLDDSSRDSSSSSS